MIQRRLSDWLILIVLAASGGVIYLLPFIQEVYYQGLMHALEADNTQIGSLLAVFGATSLLSYLPGGWLADRVAPRLLLSLSLVSTGVAGLYFATFPSYRICLAIHAFWGFSVTLLFWGAMIRVTRAWGGAEEQGRAFGLLEGGRGMAEVLTSTVLVAVFAYLGSTQAALETVITIISITTMAFGVLAWLVIREKETDEPAPVESGGLWRLRLVLKLPAVWLIAVIILAGYCAYWGTFRFTPYATDVFGLSVTIAAAISVTKMWGKPVAGVLAGFAADRVGIARSVSMLFILLTACYLFLALLPGTQGWLIAMLINIALISLLVFALRGVYFALLEESDVPMAVTGTATGLISVVGYTPDIFMPLLGGWLTDSFPGDEGYRYFFSIVAGLCASGWLATAMLQRITVSDEAT